MEPAIQISRKAVSLNGETWGVTALFSVTESPLLLDNLWRFCDSARSQGLKLMVVELAIGAAPFLVPDSLVDAVMRFRSDTVLWHKERLLNLGVSQLDAGCDKVVWLDGDLLFENPNWVRETAALLESYPVVQPFSTACWLEPDASGPSRITASGLGEGKSISGMARTMAGRDDRRRVLADYFQHGHCGFAWGVRRELLARHGLYDRRILGGGDAVMAHCFYGDQDFWRGRNMFCRYMTPAEVASMAAWGQGIHADAQGEVYFTEGRLFHLWHGDLAGRGYVERQKILWENEFDPHLDIAPDAHGCWQWNSDKPRLHKQVRAYFEGRAV